MATNIVVDSSVAVKWLIKEADSEVALSILEAYKQGRIRFSAPDLIIPEIGNIVWKKVVFDGLNVADAEVGTNLLASIELDLISSFDLYDSAFSIAVDNKRTFYDSLFLAAARKLNCDLVTADERLFNSVRSDFPNLVLMADWTG